MDFKLLLKNRWLLVLGGIGILLLLFGSVWNGRSAAISTLSPVVSPAAQNQQTQTGAPQSSTPGGAGNGNASDPNSIAGLEAAYGSDMQHMLSNLMGVNAISVMVSLNATNSLTLATTVRQSTDTTSTTGKETHRSQTVDSQPFTETNGGNSVPYVIRTTSPQVTGVLVLVNAKDFYVAKAEIIDAITNVWDVPAYNISVEPEK